MIPLLDESMENLTLDVVIDEERLEVIPFYTVFGSYSHMRTIASVTPIPISSLRR